MAWYGWDGARPSTAELAKTVRCTLAEKFQQEANVTFSLELVAMVDRQIRYTKCGAGSGSELPPRSISDIVQTTRFNLSLNQLMANAAPVTGPNQLNLVINRHFFRLHHLTFDVVHRESGVAQLDKPPHVITLELSAL